MIQIIKAGYFSSIQDLGRTEHISLGVPISGAMDTNALKLANSLLNNDLNDAAIEFCNPGAKIEFNCNTQIVITGANFNPKINGVATPMQKVINIKNGDELYFSKNQYGKRSYLAVLGGILSDTILGSKSMYKGITPKEFLTDKQVLNINTKRCEISSSKAKLRVQKESFESTEIEVFKGSEFDNLSKFQRESIQKNTFSISAINNRMAYQLNETIDNNLPSIITSIVLPGTVQLTPSGKLIILMRDCQTTGGYPRVLQLTENSINKIAQKGTNDKIIFKIKN